MLLHAPNYNVPFEPHFNFVLVTRSKRLNGWLYRSRIIYPEVWDELNLIRFTDLRRHFHRNKVSFHFNRNAMHDIASRVIDDRIFALRRPRLQRAFCAVLKYTGLISLMRLLPGRLQSPMEIVVTKAH